MGRSGRKAVQEGLKKLEDQHQPLFCIANGENAAGGIGITPDIADDLFLWGIDLITLGNHAFHKREIIPYLDAGNAIVRPSNMPPGTPGHGSMTLKKKGVELFVSLVCGRVFMEAFDDPFRETARLIEKVSTPHRFFEIHGEATSEKIAFAWWLDGKATAVVGTHTHVQTSDERILPNGTAAITDVGMCGPLDGVLGMQKSASLHRFLTSMPTRLEASEGKGVLHGVVVEAEMTSGKAVAVNKFSFTP